MTPEEVRAIAEELNFEIDYGPDGEMVLFTGVIDETKRPVEAAEAELETDADGWEDYDDNDDGEVFDPYLT